MNPAVKQGLDLAKKNIPSIACGIGVLVAAGAYFIYPIPQMYQTFGEETKAAASKYADIDGRLRAKPSVPAIFTGTGEPKPLDVFPTETVISTYEGASKRFVDEARLLVEATVKSNAQMALIGDIFPEPQRGTDVPKFREFKEAYSRKYNLDGKSFEVSIAGQILKAALPPTLTDIADLQRRNSQKIRLERTERDTSGRVINQPEVEVLVQEANAKVLSDERARRASASKIYLSPDAIRPLPALASSIATPATGAGANPGFGNTQQVNLVTLFDAQVGIWVHEAIARAVAQTNANATNIYNAPLKHLISVSWPEQLVPVTSRTPGFGISGGNPGGEAAGTTEGAAIPPPDLTTPFTPSYTNNPWGHHTNTAYFAVPISLVVRVDARRVSEVLVSLSRDNFLFVDNVSLRPVEPAISKQQGFVYGPDTVVELELQCTMLMLKSWVVPFMPPDVRSALAAAAAAPTQ